MSNSNPTGYYRDASGELKKDRREGGLSKESALIWDGVDRRASKRRHDDYEAAAREHDQMIEDALGEFAAQHEH